MPDSTVYKESSTKERYMNISDCDPSMDNLMLAEVMLLV